MDLDGFKRWLEEETYSPETVRAYLKALRKVGKGGAGPLLSSKKVSRSQRTILVAALKKYAAWAGGEEGAAILDSVRSLPRVRHHKPAPERPLDDAQWRNLVDAVEQMQGPMREVLILLCRTGLRVGDIGRIERGRAQEAVETGTLYLAVKGGDYRPYPARGSIAEALRGLLAYSWERVWESISNTSERGYYMAVNRELKRAAEWTGLDPSKVHPHLLRKTVAAQLLKSTGGDLRAVQKLLGHASIVTTEGYVAYVEVDELGDHMDALDKRRDR